MKKKRDRRKRNPDEAQTRFERWVLEQGGTAKIAALLGVHQMTVVQWIKQRNTPNAAMASKILELAKGELTLTDIVEGTRLW